MKRLPKDIALAIVKGNVADQATLIASNNDVSLRELQAILREIADGLTS